MNNLIDIIIPVYNSEKYLRDCLNSIANQDFKSFRAILVDDGSTDDSFSICNDFSDQDDRFLTIRKENGGASSARNAGLRMSTADFVMFVDADDLVPSCYLSTMYQAIESGGWNIAQCGYKTFPATATSAQAFGFVEANCNEKLQAHEVSVERALNERAFNVSVCGKIYRRSSIKNFSFTEGVIYEDDDSYYRFAYEAHRLAVIEQPMYLYRMSPNSVMRNRSTDKSLAFVDIYEARIKYFEAAKEQALVDGSHGRFCLVLMLFLAHAKKSGGNKNDWDMLWDLFKREYGKIKKTPNISTKDKLMYRAFRYAPGIAGLAICVLRPE